VHSRLVAKPSYLESLFEKCGSTFSLPLGLRTFVPQRLAKAKRLAVCSKTKTSRLFLCSDSFFHPLGPLWGVLFVVCRHTKTFLCTYPRTEEMTVALNGLHSSSASALHSGSSRNKDNTLSAKVFSQLPFHLGLPLYSVGPFSLVGFSRRELQKIR